MVDIIITGIGGQGTVSLGHLVAEVLNDMNIDFVAAETHGMSQRGGSVIFHLRIGDEKRSPIIAKQTADIIISGEPMEALRAIRYLKPGGIILTEEHGILSPVATQMGFEYPEVDELFGRMRSYTKNIHQIPSLKIAESIGSEKISNIVLLGKLLSLDVLPFGVEDMKSKIISKWPKFQDFNLKAIKAGYEHNSNISQIIN